MDNVKSIPEGYHSVNAILVVDDGAKAIDFYQKALDAKIMERFNRPDGKLMHASLKIGDSTAMLGEECPPHPGHEENCCKSPSSLRGTTTSLYLYVENVDVSFDKAIKAGGKVIMPVADMFWGDRMGQFKDPFGHHWMIATQKEVVGSEEMKKRAEEFCEKMCA